LNRWVETYGTGRKINKLMAYMICVALVGLGIAAYLMGRGSLPDATTTILYIVLGTVGEHLSVKLPNGHFLTLGDPVFFAALWCYGAPLATLTLIPPVLVQFFTQKKALLNSLFNAGQYAISLAVAEFLISAASAFPGSKTSFGQILLVLLMILAFDAVNILLVCIASSLDHEEPLVRILLRAAFTERKDSLVLSYLINVASALLASYMGLAGVTFVVAGVLALWAQFRLEREFAKRSMEARTDPLTGVYNIRYLEDWASGEFPGIVSQGIECSVVFMDVDRLKEVNDSLGHEAGDAVLIHLTRVLTSVVRSDDRIVRYGGDEFIVICKKAGIKEAESIGVRILEALKNSPAIHAGTPVTYGISLGVASFPKHATMAKDLIHMADKAMYLAKKQGGNTVCTADSL